MGLSPSSHDWQLLPARDSVPHKLSTGHEKNDDVSFISVSNFEETQKDGMLK